MDDAIRYLVVLLGEDEELYGLAVTVQYHVENVIAYDHLHETENDLVHVMEQEERGTDDVWDMENDQVSKSTTRLVGYVRSIYSYIY